MVCILVNIKASLYNHIGLIFCDPHSFAAIFSYPSVLKGSKILDPPLFSTSPPPPPANFSGNYQLTTNFGNLLAFTLIQGMLFRQNENFFLLQRVNHFWGWALPKNSIKSQ